MCRPVDLYYVGLLLFSIHCFTASAVALIYCKLFFITNTAMRPEKQLAGRIKVLHGHKKTVAYAHETCIDADSLSEGFYNPLLLPSNRFGMALNVADPPRECANRVGVGRE